MRETATLFEYVAYPFELAETDNFHDNRLGLTESTLEVLEALNAEKQFLEIGRKTIKPLNYVGVVTIGGISIQIFPKLFRNDYARHSRVIAGNLLKMLSYTDSITIREIELADLDTEDIDLFEIFIRLFARNLAHLLRTTQNRSYINTAGDLNVVKGRIDIKRYSNPVRMHIIPCTYHEFSHDNLLNRTLKYTCYLMSRTSHDFSTIKLLRTVTDILDQVTLTPVKVADIDRIAFSRLNRVFEPFIRICRIFLANSTLTLQASEVESFSLLVPMEKLFEEFIYQVMAEEPTLFFGRQAQLFSQKNIGTIAMREDGRKLFTLRPDIVVSGHAVHTSHTSSAIIDTKYKILDPDDTRYGVSQADIYQMYAYATKYGISRCMLLYPDTEIDTPRKFVLPVPSPEGIKRDVDLYIRSLCLSCNLNDRHEWNRFRDELAGIVRELIEEVKGVESKLAKCKTG